MNTVLINQKKKELKLTNDDISRLTGISLSTVSKICSGHLKNTSDDKLLKLANVLNCNLDDIKFDSVEIPITIEDKVRKLIIEKYGSISKFSEKINLNPTTVITILKNGFETGSFGRVYKICKELEIDMRTLLNENFNIEIENGCLNEVEEIILSDFRELNKKGKNKVKEYISDIAKIDEYTTKIQILEACSNNACIIATNPQIVTRRANNDYQDDDKEQELMNEDFEMMKRWKEEKK